MEGIDATLRFTERELKAIAFYASERRWRAALVAASPGVPTPERMAYEQEHQLCVAIEHKADELLAHGPNTGTD